MRIAMQRVIQTAQDESLSFEIELTDADLTADLSQSAKLARLKAIARVETIRFELQHGYLEADRRAGLEQEKDSLIQTFKEKSDASPNLP